MKKTKKSKHEELNKLFVNFFNSLVDYLKKQDINDSSLHENLSSNFVTLFNSLYPVSFIHQLISILNMVAQGDAYKKKFKYVIKK